MPSVSWFLVVRERIEIFTDNKETSWHYNSEWLMRQIIRLELGRAGSGSIARVSMSTLGNEVKVERMRRMLFKML